MWRDQLWYTQDFPFCTLPKGMSLPSPDTEVTLPFARVTPLVALKAICPSGARTTPAWLIVVALTVSLPPAESGVSGRLPAIGQEGYCSGCIGAYRVEGEIRPGDGVKLICLKCQIAGGLERTRKIGG